MSNGPTSQTILVVGGGIAGITAAVETAETGYDVILLEKSPALGGRVTRFSRYFPKLCHPTCGLEINYQRIRKNPRIKVITMARVESLSGQAGDYSVSVKTQPRYVNEKCTACGDCAKATDVEVSNDFNYGMDKVSAAYLPHEHAYPQRYVIAPEVIGTPDAEKIRDACRYGAVDLEETESVFELKVGAVIWATGWKPYDASKITPYSYDLSPGHHQQRGDGTPCCTRWANPGQDSAALQRGASQTGRIDPVRRIPRYKSSSLLLTDLLPRLDETCGLCARAV